MSDYTIELDPRQMPWETMATKMLFTALASGALLLLYWHDIASFETLALIALGAIYADTSSLWRVIVR